jgi:hypothetical protein
MALGVQAMTRAALRIAGVSALVAMAAGCAGSNSSNDALRVGGLLFGAITGQSEQVTRARAASIPYASLGVQLGSSGQGIAVLNKRAGDNRYWASGESILFVTRAGRVVETVGLPYDLSRVEPRVRGGGDGTPGTAREFALMYDFRSMGAYNVVAHCTDTDEGPETITILDAPIETRHHVERCNAEQLDWSFENEFWLDAKTGFVWQSVQDIHPRSPKLYVTVFRPESGPAPRPQASSQPAPQQ